MQQQQQPAGYAGQLQQQLPSNAAAAMTEQGNRLPGLKLPQPCSTGTSDKPYAETQQAVESVMLPHHQGDALCQCLRVWEWAGLQTCIAICYYTIVMPAVCICH